jgi:hypothetical protein
MREREAKKPMKESLISKIMAMKDLPSKELQERYEALFHGKKSPINNRTYLWRRIAYKMQEIEYGGLPKEAQNKLQELISEHDPINDKSLRHEKVLSETQAIKTKSKPVRDRRLPIPGTIITKEYKGTKIQVKTLEKGFEYQNKVYRSLTAIAKEITGAHWNGFLFFNI